MKHYKYYPNFIEEDNINYLDILLQEIKPTQDYLNINGSIIRESRLTSWQTDTNLSCSYGSKNMTAKPFTKTVKYFKEIIESKLNIKLDSVLINYYQDGNDHINYHSDEYNIHKNNDIIVVSFGDTRKFIIRKKENHEERDIYYIKNGDMFHMFNQCQKLYDHSIRREKTPNKLLNGRISLSFRYLGGK